MPQTRRTRAQKIQAAQRREYLVDESAALTETLGSTTPPSDLPGTLPASATAYAYVGQDLRRISLITLGCGILLAIATLLLSDLPWFTATRLALHLPTL